MPETLTVLAQSLESLRAGGAPPAWAEVLGPLTRPEGVRWHIDLETMVGFVAPPECGAIVSVGYGWAHNLDDMNAATVPRDRERQAAIPLLAPGERRRCRAVCLVTRSGDLGGYLREGPAILIREPPSMGRVPDCMRRALGLATPPPEESTDRLLTYLWLSQVRGAAEEAPTPLDWAAVKRWHPAVQVAREAGVDIPAAQLMSILRLASDVWSWTNLAQQASGPGWLSDLLPEGAGGWMDEGILSRWLLASFSGLDQLLDRVTPLVTPAAAKRLRGTLRQLGVLPCCHPRLGAVPNR